MSETSARQRRSQWILAVVLALLASVVGYQVLGSSATRTPPSSNQVARAAGQEAGGPPPPDIRLDTLGDAGEQPAPERNPFGFQPRAAARPGPVAGAEGGQPATMAPRPAPVTARGSAPAAAPIALKFIGTVESPDLGLIAALSDGTFVFHGREGDVIDGRYRIVKIGVESIVLEQVDGGGRQTIRLTG